MDPDLDPDPDLFVRDLQDAKPTKNFFILLPFSKVYLGHFSQMKGHKKVTKIEIKLFLSFFEGEDE